MHPSAFAALFGFGVFLAPPPVDPNPASLAVPDDLDRKARFAVRRLGTREFEAREEAQRELRDLGRFALPALLDGLKHSPVPEVTERCDQLLPRAVALDLRARIDCFTADAAGRYDHRLPAANQFFAVTGRTDSARKLFRDLLLSANRSLVTAVGGPDDDVARLAAVRRAELNPRAVVVGGAVERPPPAAALDVLALLFVESTIPEKALLAADGGAVRSPAGVITQSQLKATLEAEPNDAAARAVTVRWFETRTESRTVYSGMSTAALLKLPVAVTLAKKVLADKTSTPQYKAAAAATVAKVGTAADVPLLDPLLADETQAHPGLAVVVGGAPQRSPIQVRDAGLAMSLLLTKQDPADYGMKSRYAGGTTEALRFSYYNYYFEDGDDVAGRRTAAIKKWGEWRAKNLKAEGKK